MQFRPTILCLSMTIFCLMPILAQEKTVQPTTVLTVDLPEVYELSNIILALTEYGQTDQWEVRKNIPYYKEVMDYFAPVLSHPLLKEANYSRALWKNYLSFRTDAYAFAFDQSGNIKRVFEFQTNDGYAPFDSNLALVNDFVRQSRFREFFKNHLAYYQSIQESYIRNYMIEEMRQFLIQHFGDKTKGRAYRVVLSPLVYRMNCHRENEEALFDFPTVADYILTDKPGQNTERNRVEELHTLFTEMDHAFVNPVSDSFISEINRSFADTLWATEEAGYSSPYETFNEYMTWAVYDLFTKKYFPTLADEINLYWHFQNKNRGFIYSSFFANKLLALYESTSPRQPVRDLYPKILAWSRDVQTSLSEPTVTSPQDSLIKTKPGPMFITLRFSEAMVPASEITVLLRDSTSKRDTVQMNYRNKIAWSNGNTELSFLLDVPSGPKAYMMFNWWGTNIPLRSARGVLLKSPTFFYIK